ncbi:TRAP transporter small permease [Pseudorhodoplanes sp.]|uniref:TRAP transporter small permease n=1 Tax=Pseudorhodoplanes sp. TaxID=1934341 RepID=UPI003918DAA6
MSAPAKRGIVDRVIDAIEVTAAIFLAAVTLLTFVSVGARYLFSFGILDAYDFSRLLLGILIFWGIAVTSYRGDHITVDLLWSWGGPGLKRALDTFASLVSLGAMLVFTWMMGEQVLSTRASNLLTFDLRYPVWIFYFVAWIGLACAILLLVVRTIRLIVRPEVIEQQPHVKVD